MARLNPSCFSVCMQTADVMNYEAGRESETKARVKVSWL